MDFRSTPPVPSSSSSSNLEMHKEKLRLLAQRLQPSICRPGNKEAAVLQQLGVTVPDWEDVYHPRRVRARHNPQPSLPPAGFNNVASSLGNSSSLLPWPQPMVVPQPPALRNAADAFASPPLPSFVPPRIPQPPPLHQPQHLHHQPHHMDNHAHIVAPPSTQQRGTKRGQQQQPPMPPQQQQQQPMPKLNRAVKGKSNVSGRTYTSKFRGVHQTFPTKRWEAQFRRNGKPTSLGCFDREDQAAEAYDKMMIWCELHNTAGVKGGITNYDGSKYKEELPWLHSITQDELINSLRGEGRRQAAQRMMRQKRDPGSSGKKSRAQANTRGGSTGADSMDGSTESN
uniref:Wrinkled 1 n=1 Tax=Dunaliella parva TaxID=3048 RepID=A0A1P8A762_9CHLO|nr:wrinkled 1 [Dunaliella parva]